MDSIKIDWSKPIEAVHADGRIVSVETWGGVDYSGDCVTKPKIDGVEGIWRSDGTPWGADYSGRETIKHWRLRNTPSATPTRTALEQRMEDLVRRMDGIVVPANTSVSECFAEARAILAELEPVDVDLLIAREMALAAHPDIATTTFVDGKADSSSAVQYRLEGIRRGRALERGE
jgi:hypothetical protein